jgi:hypothetical protein
MTLYAATKPQHHACERHPFGTRLSKGEVTPGEYGRWLASLEAMHSVADMECPRSMSRAAGFVADRHALLANPQGAWVPAKAAAAWRDTAWTANLIGNEPMLGAAYVLHGAHRTGGQIMRPIMTAKGMPTWHLYYPDMREAKRFVDDLRAREDLKQYARRTFDVLLACMDEIGG